MTMPLRNLFKLLPTTAVALLATACATTSTQGEYSSIYHPESAPPAPPAASSAPSQPVGRPVPIPITQDGQPASDASLAMVTPPPALPNYPKTAEEVSSPPVIALIRQARAASAAGKYDQASASLESAQRIEPRNCFVWSALARVYLDKKLYDNAEGVAQKSNSLARGNVYVELENWKVISAAREAEGDAAGMIQAQTKVDEIQRNLGGG